MSVHYSYECTKATLVAKIPGDFGSKKLYLFDLEFDNEHGLALAPVASVLVSVEDGHAELVQYPENVEPKKEDFDRIAKLADNHPGYDVYNPETFSELVDRAVA